jgi:manganese/zinc/iron transport system permease protein
MSIGELFSLLITDHTIRTVAFGTAILGVVSGALGAFAVLRRQALLGDALSHAALPGVALAFMFTGQKTPAVLMIGAAIVGIMAILLLSAVTRVTRLKEDSVLGIILSVFFGFGLMLLTFLQRNPDARQAGLNTFLFGQAATLLTRDVLTMAAFGLPALVILAIFWKEFKLLSFDREFGSSLGFPMRGLDTALTSLLVVAVVIGLQAVGVVLMSAMLVAPGAAARQWTDRLSHMVLISALFGAIAGVAGALISSLGNGLSTGPVIVIVVSVIVVISLFFAPNRGLFWRRLRIWRNRRRYQAETVLLDFYRMAAQHADATQPHPIAALLAIRPGAQFGLDVLASRDLARPDSEGHWRLTPAGVAEAELLESGFANENGVTE